MEPDEFRQATMLGCVLHFLPDEMRCDIRRYLDGRCLDAALKQMLGEKKFPNWFREGFYRDAKSDKLGNLRIIVGYATERGLFIDDGMRLCCAEASDGNILKLLECIGVQEAEARSWATDLAAHLAAKPIAS